MKTRRILAAVELGPMAHPVVETASELAQGLDSELTVVHVCSPPTVVVGATPLAMPATVESKPNEDIARAKLNTLTKPLEERGIPTRSEVAVGAAGSTVLDVATKIDADYVVVGRSHRGAIERTLLGSVSQEIVKNASCPVVVVDASRGDAG